ncbi:hypothetical protein [Rhizobium sp. NRK18]|uniref:hypothetical protein n=1 Tax=Rhizobium sp. NRK18 TaxID=2964667 RepID=UPI0021C3E291|nr:hypothetical protein [Rhizobium sp. NRK18]MCQ2002366.1 hypothetical protein [Rhizobium sp. NRK18]
MTSLATHAGSKATLPQAVILLGRDDKGKAHASFFPATDSHAAHKAADLMGMLALKVETDEVRGFLKKLPKGKLFDSGKAFVPFVKQDLYREIASHLPEEDRVKAEQVRVAPAAEEGEPLPVKPVSKPKDWDEVVVGSVVLIKDGAGEPWYEATVISIKDDGTYRLKWRDFLEEPAFNRRIEDIGLMHPAFVEK